MSETKHTPGPWYIAFGGLEGDDHFTVASKISPGIVAEYAVAGPRPSAEVIANARLVAATPELFDACREALELLTEGGPEAYRRRVLAMLAAALAAALPAPASSDTKGTPSADRTESNTPPTAAEGNK